VNVNRQSSIVNRECMVGSTGLYFNEGGMCVIYMSP
jgi:hypothetical protein